MKTFNPPPFYQSIVQLWLIMVLGIELWSLGHESLFGITVLLSPQPYSLFLKQAVEME